METDMGVEVVVAPGTADDGTTENMGERYFDNLF